MTTPLTTLLAQIQTGAPKLYHLTQTQLALQLSLGGAVAELSQLATDLQAKAGEQETQIALLEVQRDVALGKVAEQATELDQYAAQFQEDSALIEAQAAEIGVLKQQIETLTAALEAKGKAVPMPPAGVDQVGAFWKVKWPQNQPSA